MDCQSTQSRHTFLEMCVISYIPLNWFTWGKVNQEVWKEFDYLLAKYILRNVSVLIARIFWVICWWNFIRTLFCSRKEFFIFFNSEQIKHLQIIILTPRGVDYESVSFALVAFVVFLSLNTELFKSLM